MKKTYLILTAAIAFTFAVSSCGNKPTLMTTDEMQHNIDSIYTAKSAELETELDELCDARFETYISEALDTILAQKDPAVQ